MRLRDNPILQLTKFITHTYFGIKSLQLEATTDGSGLPTSHTDLVHGTTFVCEYDFLLIISRLSPWSIFSGLA
jgi:hypothetical protein